MQVKITIILLALAASCLARVDPFSYLNFFQYCTALNYPVEDHVIPTDDHYNLRFYRIQAKGTKIAPGKKVIYLQHGLVDSSDTWVVNDEHLAPAFILANRGFDVWLGNSRGNRYSTKEMSPGLLDFWNFTFHEMGTYDLPAAFRYIVRVTNRKIHYIGHSQGTMSMFIALSLQTKLVTDNLLSFNAFGPVAYLKHQKSKLLVDGSKISLPDVLLKSHIKSALFLGKDGLRANSDICIFTPFICAGLLKAISEENNTVNNMRRLPVVMGHFPSGSSTKNFIHFQQFVKKAEFKQFDYGAAKNQKIYNQKTPPFYPLSKIAFPVHLYVGKYDKLADPQDSSQLFNELTNSVGKTMKLYDFGHATFVWGKSTVHIEDALKVIESVTGDVQFVL